jgi:cell division protein FtsQ
MKEQRKISIRKILQVLLTILVGSGCIVAMVSASKLESDKNLSNVVVHLKNDKKYHFIEEKEIMDLAINNRHVDVMHTPLAKLDVHAIEQVIKSDPWVAEAQAFIDMNRVLHMYVTQRVPVVRIFERNGESYFMDATLHTMPLSQSSVYYTTVVTNVPELSNDTASRCMKQELYSLVRALQTDTFWNAQVSQVVVDSAGMFELVPVIGNQRIIFGDTTGTKDKLENLFAFYKQVLNRIGWDKYETLDLRFNNQVVASPSLPYKGPVDRVVDKMNWINSIIITEAQNDMKDSLNAADVKGLMAGSTGGTAIVSSQVAPKAAIAKTTQAPPAAVSKAVVKTTVATTTAAKGGISKNVAKAAVVAGGIGAGILVAKQIKKANAASLAKPQPVPVKGKGAVPAKQPVASTMKGKVVAKSVTKHPVPAHAKMAAKQHAAAGKGKVAAKAEKFRVKSNKNKKGAKTAAKNTKKAAKKTVKGEGKKEKKSTNEKHKTEAKPKYAYPENKGH